MFLLIVTMMGIDKKWVYDKLKILLTSNISEQGQNQMPYNEPFSGTSIVRKKLWC